MVSEPTMVGVGASATGSNFTNSGVVETHQQMKRMRVQMKPLISAANLGMLPPPPADPPTQLPKTPFTHSSLQSAALGPRPPNRCLFLLSIAATTTTQQPSAHNHHTRTSLLSSALDCAPPTTVTSTALLCVFIFPSPVRLLLLPSTYPPLLPSPVPPLFPPTVHPLIIQPPLRHLLRRQRLLRTLLKVPHLIPHLCLSSFGFASSFSSSVQPLQPHLSIAATLTAATNSSTSHPSPPLPPLCPPLKAALTPPFSPSFPPPVAPFLRSLLFIQSASPFSSSIQPSNPTTRPAHQPQQRAATSSSSSSSSLLSATHTSNPFHQPPPSSPSSPPPIAPLLRPHFLQSPPITPLPLVSRPSTFRVFMFLFILLHQLLLSPDCRSSPHLLRRVNYRPLQFNRSLLSSVQSSTSATPSSLTALLAPSTSSASLTSSFSSSAVSTTAVQPPGPSPPSPPQPPSPSSPSTNNTESIAPRRRLHHPSLTSPQPSSIPSPKPKPKQDKSTPSLFVPPFRSNLETRFVLRGMD